ncbi:MAG: hypothetical protein ACLVB5_14105 [Christensenellales bacterium]
MPEVFLTATSNKLSSVFMVSTYVRSDEKKVSGLVVSGNDKAADFSCAALQSYLFENRKEIARVPRREAEQATAVSAGAPEEDKMKELCSRAGSRRRARPHSQGQTSGGLARERASSIFKVVTRIDWR